MAKIQMPVMIAESLGLGMDNRTLAKCFGVRTGKDDRSLIRGERLLAKLEAETPQSADCDYLAPEVTTAPPGSGDRVVALAAYYTSDEGKAEISPFEEEAGAIAVEIFNSPQKSLAQKENLADFLRKIGVIPA